MSAGIFGRSIFSAAFPGITAIILLLWEPRTFLISQAKCVSCKFQRYVENLRSISMRTGTTQVTSLRYRVSGHIHRVENLLGSILGRGVVGNDGIRHQPFKLRALSLKANRRRCLAARGRKRGHFRVIFCNGYLVGNASRDLLLPVEPVGIRA